MMKINLAVTLFVLGFACRSSAQIDPRAMALLNRAHSLETRAKTLSAEAETTFGGNSRVLTKRRTRFMAPNFYFSEECTYPKGRDSKQSLGRPSTIQTIICDGRKLFHLDDWPFSSGFKAPKTDTGGTLEDPNKRRRDYTLSSAPPTYHPSTPACLVFVGNPYRDTKVTLQHPTTVSGIPCDVVEMESTRYLHRISHVYIAL